MKLNSWLSASSRSQNVPCHHEQLKVHNLTNEASHCPTEQIQYQLLSCSRQKQPILYFLLKGQQNAILSTLLRSFWSAVILFYNSQNLKNALSVWEGFVLIWDYTARDLGSTELTGKLPVVLQLILSRVGGIYDV